MCKNQGTSAPKFKKYGGLAYQIRKLEIAPSGKEKPMLTQTARRYKHHAQKFAEWCKTQYRCKTLEECKLHIQEYANFLAASGKTPSTIHTYLAGVCRVFDVPLETIQKPIRVVAESQNLRLSRRLE